MFDGITITKITSQTTIDMTFQIGNIFKGKIRSNEWHHIQTGKPPNKIGWFRIMGKYTNPLANVLHREKKKLVYWMSKSNQSSVDEWNATLLVWLMWNLIQKIYWRLSLLLQKANKVNKKWSPYKSSEIFFLL